MRHMVSRSIGLVVVGTLVLAAFAVGGVVASAVALSGAASRNAGDHPRSDIPSAVQDALEDREPGEGIGDIISELANDHRPRPRH